MTDQKRRMEDQLPEQRIDWEHGGEPSSEPIRVERQQALLNCAAALLKAERAACAAVVFPESEPQQFVMIGAADDILRLLPLPGATDGLLRATMREITTLLIENENVDHLFNDPDLVRLLSALTTMAVRRAAKDKAPAAAPAAGQAGLASWQGAADWLRNNAYLYPNLTTICDAMVAASPEAAPVAADTEQAPDDLNGGMHASIFVKVWGDAGGGDAGRIALANYAYALGKRDALSAPAEVTEQATIDTPPFRELLDEFAYWASERRAMGGDYGSADNEEVAEAALIEYIDSVKLAPLATPADAGAGWTPTTGNKQVDSLLSEYEIRADSGVYTLTAHDRWVISNFLIELDEELPFLARMSTSGARPNADCSGDPSNCPDNEGYGCDCGIGQSPAPVTAEPARSIDTPEFLRLMEGYKAGEVAYRKVLAHIATHSAPADRDAIRNKALEEAAKACEGVQDKCQRRDGGKWPELRDDAESGAGQCAEAVRALKSMERAADAAETRDAKGGEK